MRNVLRKAPVRTDMAIVKIKGGGTNRIPVSKTFNEEKKKSSLRVMASKNCLQ